MQMRQSAAGVGGHQVAIAPEGAQRWDFVSPDQDEVLALLRPSGDRKRTVILIGSPRASDYARHIIIFRDAVSVLRIILPKSKGR